MALIIALGIAVAVVGYVALPFFLGVGRAGDAPAGDEDSPLRDALAEKEALYDAIQELETVLSIRSSFFPALKNLAVLYQNAGFRNKALEMWERCLAAAPDEETRQSIKRHLVAVL